MVILRPFVARAARRVRHGFGVAEVAHVLILCLNETGGARACVADPFVRAKGYERLRYVHRTPRGRKQQVVSTTRKGGLEMGRCQSLRRVTTRCTARCRVRGSRRAAQVVR